MNRMIVSLIIGFSMSLTAIAETEERTPQQTPSVQPEPEHIKHHGIKLKQLSQELGLSDKQKSEIKSLFKKHKQKIREIREESKQEIQGTLTPAQKLKLYQMKEKNSENIKALKQAVEEEETSAKPR